MFNITPSEFLIIAVLALVVLGPERLPDMARGLGRLINRAREMTSDLRETVDSISDDPTMKPLKDLGELATRPREKLAEFAAEAAAEDRAERAAKERATAEETSDQDARAKPDGWDVGDADTTDTEADRVSTETYGTNSDDSGADGAKPNDPTGNVTEQIPIDDSVTNESGDDSDQGGR